METNNLILKNKMRSNKVKQWLVADKVGMQESALSKMLRYPLSEDQAEKINTAIDELIKERDAM